MDRDGIINVDPIGDYVKRWEEFKFEEDALKSLKAICDLDFEIVIISNQAGVGDGVYPEIELWNIHRHMLEVFEKNGIRIRDAYYCLHGKKAGCRCRKPRTGLLERAVEGVPFDRGRTFFIGDKASDMEAARRFGIRTIFVLKGHGKRDLPKLKGDLKPDHVVQNLSEAVPLLSENPPKRGA